MFMDRRKVREVKGTGSIDSGMGINIEENLLSQSIKVVDHKVPVKK